MIPNPRAGSSSPLNIFAAKQGFNVIFLRFFAFGNTTAPEGIDEL
jgi:hypothetical protein